MYTKQLKKVIADYLENQNRQSCSLYDERIKFRKYIFSKTRLLKTYIEQEKNGDQCAHVIKYLNDFVLPTCKKRIKEIDTKLEQFVYINGVKILHKPNYYQFLKEAAEIIGNPNLADDSLLSNVAKFDFDKFCSSTNVISNPSFHNLGASEQHDAYFDDYFIVLDIAKKNGEVGLKRLERLNNEMAAKFQSTIIFEVKEYAKEFGKDSNYVNNLLMLLTSRKSVFKVLKENQIAILINDRSDFIDQGYNGKLVDYDLKRYTKTLVHNKQQGYY